MFEPRFNPNHDLVLRSRILLGLGIVGALCGLGSEVSGLAMELGAVPLMSEGTVDAIMEALFVVARVGLGLGFLGLGMLYNQSLCHAVGGLRLFLLADLYFLGLATGLGRIGAVATSLVLIGLAVAAMVMLFRVAKLRFVYVGAGAWMLLAFLLGWLPLGTVFDAILGVLSSLVMAALFGAGIYGALTAKPTPPGPSPYAAKPAPYGYPPAGGGYPPAGGGYPPAGGGYPPAGGGYPPAR